MSDLQRIKKALEGAVNKRKQAELNSRSEEIMTTIGQDLVSALSPVLKEIAGQSGGNNESLVREITSAVTQAMREVKIEIPEFEIPDNSIDLEPILDAIRNIKIEVPQSQVNVPAPVVNIPKTVFPEFPKYPEEIGLRGIDKTKPLPVMMMDGNGKQFQFPIGASGGKADFFTIKSFSQSAFSELSNADGRLRVSVETGGSGLTDSELRASSVPVAQASGAIWSTSVKDIFGSTITSDVLNGDNRIRVSVETGGSGLTDSELRASAVPVSQLSGASWSVVVNEVFGSVATNVVNPDGRLKVELPTGSSGLTDTELRASPVVVDLGANNDVTVSGAITSTGAYLLNGDGTYRDSLPVTGTFYQATQPVSAASLPLPSGASTSANQTTIIGHVDGIEGLLTTIDTDTGSIATSNSAIQTAVQIMDDWDEVHDSPVGSDGALVMAEARTSNPTAVANGDATRLRADKLGRQISRPVQIRELTTTAYTSLSTGTETTLLAGSASTFHDLIYVMGANQSDAAVTVDFRCGTAGAVVLSLQIPANGTAGIACPVPLPMPEVAQAWTADMDDITGTVVDITALFSKEI